MQYELGVASSKVYDFIWDTYCDWYIELTKTRLYSEDETSKLAAQKVLVYVLDQVLQVCCIRSCRSSPRKSGRQFRTRASS